MEMGIFKSPSRVVVEGRLITYAGEVMTTAEAHKRGLGETAEKAAVPKKAASAKAAKADEAK